jgi:hypothetical protein
MPRRAAPVTQAAIARALRAIEQTGVRVAIEISPDGTIRLVPDREFCKARGARVMLPATLKRRSQPRHG